MKITAKAPANIAFIKYWGKKDETLRLPMNSSISMNLSGVYTTTEVEFSDNLESDQVRLDGKLAEGKERERVVKFLELVRKLAKINTRAEVSSKNNFPKGTGIASSASGFAALALASTSAAGLSLSEKELSILSRKGSGSACRSIPDGFVEWKAGDTNYTSYAHSLYQSDYWDIVDVIAIVGRKSKKVSSTEGHAKAYSSPFYKTRISGMKKKVRDIKAALSDKNFTKFGEIVESEALNMHAVMMTSEPSLIYWYPETLSLIHEVKDWRRDGLEVYFTIDAGPNLHLICLGKEVYKLKNKLKKLEVDEIIVSRACDGARILYKK